MRADEHAAAELSEAAQTELLNLCEEQFAQLEKVIDFDHNRVWMYRCELQAADCVSLCCSFRMTFY